MPTLSDIADEIMGDDVVTYFETRDGWTAHRETRAAAHRPGINTRRSTDYRWRISSPDGWVAETYWTDQLPPPSDAVFLARHDIRRAAAGRPIHDVANVFHD